MARHKISGSLRVDRTPQGEYQVRDDNGPIACIRGIRADEVAAAAVGVGNGFTADAIQTLTRERDEALSDAAAYERSFDIACAQRDELAEALRGVQHHNAAVKDQYKLPESLMRHIATALSKVAS